MYFHRERKEKGRVRQTDRERQKGRENDRERRRERRRKTEKNRAQSLCDCQLYTSKSLMGKNVMHL